MIPRICILLALAAPAIHGHIVNAQARNLHTDLAEVVVRQRTDHYALAGTVSDGRLADYGRALEYIHGEYAAGFAELLNPGVADQNSIPKGGKNKKAKPGNESSHEQDRPSEPSAPAAASDDRFLVIILATDAQYKEFTDAYFSGRAEHTRGLYVPAAKLLLIRDDPVSSETYEVLFHEAFHQFVHRHVPAVPIWVNEGLATYYGTARPTSNGLAFDRPRSVFFQVVKEAADAKCLIPLTDLMQADPRVFLSPDRLPGVGFSRGVLHYAQAYTLVAFMLSDDAGAEHLREYLRALAGAKNAAAARRKTREIFSEDLLDEMVAPWLAFVNKY